MNIRHQSLSKVLGRPFVERFALLYRIVVCLSVSPLLSVCNVAVLRQNGWMDQDGTWLAGRPRSRPHCVRWGPSSPKGGTAPAQFAAHLYCGQTAGWMKMPLGTEVDLGPRHIVLDGDPASTLPQGAQQLPSSFRPTSIMATIADLSYC